MKGYTMIILNRKFIEKIKRSFKSFRESGLITFAVLIVTAGNMQGQSVNTGSGATVSLNSSTITLNGSWNNSGVLNEGAGEIVFIGTNDQTIVNQDTFYNLTLNKPAGTCTILNNIWVNAIADILNGTLDLNGHTLTIGSSGLLNETPGNLATGGTISVTKDINAPSSDNIGDLGAEITSSANLGSTTVIRGSDAQLIEGNAGINRYFDITPTNNTGLNATLVFHYDETELNGLWASELQLFSSTDGGTFWTARGGTTDSIAKSITLVGINSFSRWTLAGVNLPISFQLSVDIAEGWNMTSVPGINPDGMGVDNWWANLTGTVYKFVPGSGYSSITATTPGEGYWMKNSGAETYTYPAIQIVTNNPIGATGGWNMFGGYENIVNVTTLTTTPPDLIVYPIYKYVPGTGYQTATELEPGYGYWVKVAGNCQINVPEAFGKGTKKPAIMVRENWGRIIVADAAGNSYTLYTVKENSHDAGTKVDLSKYELPPLPPTGVFDIRFSSGRIAEDINHGFQTIEMRGIKYPVKVKVENMDFRLQDVTGKEINMNIRSGEEVTISDHGINKLIVSEELIPAKYALEQNYPNPFNPSTTIVFSLPLQSLVTLKVFDILGREIETLINEEKPAGIYKLKWDASKLPSGIYFYRLQAALFDGQADSYTAVKKMIYLK